MVGAGVDKEGTLVTDADRTARFSEENGGGGGGRRLEVKWLAGSGRSVGLALVAGAALIGRGAVGAVEVGAILDSVWYASLIACTMCCASRTASGPPEAVRSGCQRSMSR